MTEQRLGTVRVSPGVMSTLARLTAESNPGVVRVGASRRGPLRFVPERLLGRSGVTVHVAPDGVRVELSLVVQQGASLIEVASLVQREVGEAIEKMIGLPVREVNVRILDVQ